MKELSKVTKRLNIDIPPKIHTKLKMIALNKNITLRMLLLRVIIKLIDEDDKHNN